MNCCRNTRNTRAAVRRAPRHPPPPRVPPCPAAPTPRPPAPQPPTGTPTMATGARGTLWPRDVSVDQSEDGLLCAGSSGIWADSSDWWFLSPFFLYFFLNLTNCSEELNWLVCVTWTLSRESPLVKLGGVCLFCFVLFFERPCKGIHGVPRIFPKSPPFSQPCSCFKTDAISSEEATLNNVPF